MLSRKVALLDLPVVLEAARRVDGDHLARNKHFTQRETRPRAVEGDGARLDEGQTISPSSQIA